MMRLNKAIATLTRRRDFLDRCLEEDPDSPGAAWDRTERAALERAIKSMQNEGAQR